MHRLKTGALIKFACQAPAILANIERDFSKAVVKYANDIGILYQITDDLLDVTGSNNILGKTAGKDAKQNKATFVKILGEQKARQQAEVLAAQAISHLNIFGEKAKPLCKLVQFILERDR